MSGEWLNPEDMQTVGDRVRFFRLSQSLCGTKTPWTRKELGAKAGCADCTIRNIEDELRPVSEPSLRAVCGALGVRMSMLTRQDKFLECVRVLGLKAPGKAPSIKRREDVKDGGARWAANRTRPKPEGVRVDSRKRAKADDRKDCAFCGEEFRRNDKISAYDWAKKRYCSARCGGLAVQARLRAQRERGVA